MAKENPLGTEKISKLVLKIALPSMLAQFVSVLYSIVDRMFVGNISGVGDVSLAGVGICGPIVTMIGAFAAWVGIGGAPFMSMAMGEKNNDKARHILANSFVLLGGISVVATALALLLREPMLRLFGASDATYPYAEQYFTIYVCGTVFALMATGMCQFIVAQGHAKTGMFSVIIGAVLNVILDPVFIFVFNMGVRGAALATIISQAVSAAFVLFNLFKITEIKITFGNYKAKTMLRVIKMGFSPYLIIAMDNIMIIAMNALLQKYGGARGDMLITVNTITQSFMLVMSMPLGGISGGTQCILSYNYGAGRPDRVLKAQKWIMGLCAGYTFILFVLSHVAGTFFVSLFTSDPEIANEAFRAIRICTLAIVPLGIQYEIVDGFTALGKVHLSLPLSCSRKFFFFISLFLLPVFFDISNIFFAETISDISTLFVSVPVYFWQIKKVLGLPKKQKKLKA